MNVLFFLIPFLLFPAFADNTDITPITTGTKTDETIKKFDVSSIEIGSRIDSAIITVNIDDDVNRFCVVKISDPVLNEIPISDKFRCAGQMPIILNQNGKFFVENQIKKGDLSFAIKHADDNTVVKSTIADTNISFTKPTYFAKIENGIVANVIVADSSFIQTQNGQWVETFLDDRYAGKGYSYNSNTGEFVSPYKEQVKEP